MAHISFGLGLSPSAAPGADPVGAARQAEELGFDFLSLSDHPCGVDPTYETWTVLCWIAAATSRIRVMPRVLGVPYRPPPMVAKMAESLHRLSGGRLVLGLGGGYSDDEFRAFGLGIPSPGDKVRGLAEAIQIMRGLWSQPRFSFDGGIYRTHEAAIAPRPASDIPIWLGTFGPRALAVTGGLADGWIPSYGYRPLAQVPGMRARMLAAAQAAGREPGQITCAFHVQIRIDERAQPSPGIVTGPPGVVAEELIGFVELGFTALSLAPVGEDRREQAERIAKEIIPAVRTAV